MVKSSSRVAPEKLKTATVKKLNKSIDKEAFRKFLKYSEGEDRTWLSNLKKLTKLGNNARVSSAESTYKRKK